MGLTGCHSLMQHAGASNTFAIICKRPVYLMIHWIPWIAVAMARYPQSPRGFRHTMILALRFAAARMILGKNVKRGFFR
jgi:hypothetical protein